MQRHGDGYGKDTLRYLEHKLNSKGNGVGRAGQLHEKKNETWSLIYTIHKNKLKVDKRIKYKLLHHKNHSGGHSPEGRKISDIPHSNIFTDMSPRAREGHKGKNKQMELHQNKKLLHS